MIERTLTAKGRATRERIIRTAAELFEQNSYAAVSIRQIAERSGVSSGAIYATFSGKADVLAEAVGASLSADLEIIDPDLVGRPLPEIVGVQFRRLDDSGRRRLRLLLLNAAAAARSNPDVRDRLRVMLQDRLSGWTSAYAEWQQSGGAGPEFDMAALVTLLIAADLGLAVLDELGVDAPDSSSAALIIGRMLEGLSVV